MSRWMIIVALMTATGCARPQKPSKMPAPPFELKDLGGGSMSLTSFHGKVVVLDFWATWCGPCVAELPDLADFSRKNAPRGVEVVGVVFDSGEPKAVSEFVQEHKIPYRQLIGTDAVEDSYDASGFPTTIVIDPGGTLVSRLVGSIPGKFERLQKDVDAALNKPAS